MNCPGLTAGAFFCGAVGVRVAILSCRAEARGVNKRRKFYEFKGAEN